MHYNKRERARNGEKNCIYNSCGTAAVDICLIENSTNECVSVLKNVGAVKQKYDTTF